MLASVNAFRSQMDNGHISAQNEYKRDNDKHVRKPPVSAPLQLVYVDKPPLTASSTEDVAKIALTTYNNLMPKKIETFLFIAIDDHIPLINQNGVYNTIYILRATLEPGQDTASVALPEIPLLSQAQ